MDSEQIVHDVAERVRKIVSEAEESAARIVRDAEAEAKRIRERAEADGKQRLDEVRKALDELQGKLGGGANGAVSEVTPGPAPVPEPEPPSVPEPTPEPVPEPYPEPTPAPEPPSVPEPTPPPDEGTPPAAGADDTAAARLVAMNMALDGASRDEIEAKLAADYELDDAGALADEVRSLAAK